MRCVVVGLLIGSLVLGVTVLPVEANGWGRHGHHWRHGHGDDHFVGGFVAGAATVLVLDALLTPRVVYAVPVVYEPVYYRVPACRDAWVPGYYALRPRVQNGFTTYYQVWMPGYWQRQCY
jgi:hypothetical protein